MSAALLDVNVLVALFEQEHLNHENAHEWFAAEGQRSWASCPLTINGCIRVLSRPRSPGPPLTLSEGASRLRDFCLQSNHQFWPDDLSLLDESRFKLKLISGPKQLTDVYLLALAVERKGQLVTFDRSIPWQAVPGAKASHLQILGALA